MNLRLGGALALTALTTTAMLSAPTPAANAGVEIVPPEVGDCHALTYAEAYAASDTKAPVECTEPHTTITVKVVKLAAPMDVNAIPRSAFVRCLRATRLALGDRPKSQAMSSYETWYYVPTQAERQAGAAWLRCDLVLRGGKRLQALPTDGAPTLTRLPLSKNVALCLLKVRGGAIGTVCSRAHNHRAVAAILNRGKGYPGQKKVKAYAQKKCYAKLGRRFSYYNWPTRTGWKAGYRYSVCFRPSGSNRVATSSSPRPLVGEVDVLTHPAVHGDRSSR